MIKFEPFTIELVNDGHLVEVCHVEQEISTIVSSFDGGCDSRFSFETSSILKIADAIRERSSDKGVNE